MKESGIITTEYSTKRELIVFLLMLFVAFSVYWQSLGNGFLINWDDPNYIVNNQDAHGFSMEHLKNAFSRFYVGNYAPLHIVSYMFDYTICGLKPAGYIIHNILIHAVNSYLLYRIVCRISATFYPSVLSALLFLVHPVQVESVAWMSQRKNLLAMLFFLMAILYYQHYISSDTAARKKNYALALVFFACALLTKSVTVILPVVLLLYDVCIVKRPLRNALLDKIPFIAIAFATSVVAMLSQSEDYGGGGRAAFYGGSPFATFLTMLPVFVTYLRMIVVPTGLSGVYSPDIKTAVDPSVAGAGIILLALTALALFTFLKDRKLFFWLAFGVVGIIPVSQVVPLVTMMNDRYLYFPMAGAAPLIVLWGLKIIPQNSAQLRYTAALCMGLILVAFAVMASNRGLVWKNSYILWSDAVKKDPGNVTAKYNLANVYMEANQLDKVKPLLAEILAVRPKSARFHEMLGNYYYRLGDIKNAEASYKRALELWPRLHFASFCMGNIYLAKGELKSAEEAFSSAGKYAPMTPDLSYSLACLESLKGDVPKAVNYLDGAFKLGFRGCQAVKINRELDAIRNTNEYQRIMKSYCLDGGK